MGHSNSIISFHEFHNATELYIYPGGVRNVYLLSSSAVSMAASSTGLPPVIM